MPRGCCGAIGGRRRPELWFTYHLYHKAPDWLGPPVSRALAHPLPCRARRSLARKQAAGPWAAGYAASLAAIAEADLVLAVTGHDVPGLAAAVLPERLRLFPPFLDATPFVAAASLRSRKPTAEPLLLAVAMMRRDVKLLSYRLLAEALLVLDDLPWRLALVGDGEARDEVAAFFKPFGARVLLLGVRSSAALAEIYAKADLYVWPACNEAYGMAMLEAQAAGVPVVAGREGGVPDIVVDGTTGLLVEPRSPSALAAAVRALLGDPDAAPGHGSGGAGPGTPGGTIWRRRGPG